MSEINLSNKFWREFCRENADANPDHSYQVWFFGNNAKMARELVELVLQNKKTATASLAEENERNPEAAPVLGGYSVVTDFEGNPQCVIQTTEIRRLPFDEVDAQFAFDEGEGDRTLEYWRQVHWLYFSQEAKKLEIEFDEKSLITCERFQLLFPKK